MFVVIIVWFCCLSWIVFLIMTDFINLMRHFSLHWVFCVGDDVFVDAHFVLRNTLPHLVDNYTKNMDELGRNFMCERTLPSLLVSIQSFVLPLCRISSDHCPDYSPRFGYDQTPMRSLSRLLRDHCSNYNPILVSHQTSLRPWSGLCPDFGFWSGPLATIIQTITRP